MARGPKNVAQEAQEEAREAAVPGARGHEYRDRERVGDEGPAFRRGGEVHHKEHHKEHERRARGGYMPEETEASERKRGQRGGEEAQENETDEKDEREGEESYKDERTGTNEAPGRKRGGAMKKRARGGRLTAEEEHKRKLEEKGPHHPHHHPRKRGGKVPGKMAKSRPDRRSRGGATADLSPTTAAGNMSVPDYERQPKIPNGGGIGRDNKGDRRLD